MARRKQALHSLFLLCLLGICLTPFIQTHQISFYDAKQTAVPLASQEENWGNKTDPYILSLNTLYTVPNNNISFTTFFVQAEAIYYIYLGGLPAWNAELYNDSAYSILLGTFYQLPFSLGSYYYMTFSPGHSGWYYLLLYSDIPMIDGKVIIFNARAYTVNTTQPVVISPETCPAQFFSADLVQGNYSTTQDRLYVRVERGGDYVFLPQMYGKFGPTPTYVENGTYGLIFEKSCNFCMMGYPLFQKDETVPDDVTQMGNWENSSDPFVVTLDTYYTIPHRDLLFAAFYAQAGAIYYIYLDGVPNWDAELYNDSAYTTNLGPFYRLPLIMGSPYINHYYMIFSPRHSGWYYLLLYCEIPLIDGSLAILNAIPYTVNTTQLVVISPRTCPVQFFNVDLVQGNYSATREELYVRVERGGDYVLLPEMYGTLGSISTYLENGTYGFIFQESRNFCLTGYPLFPKNETIPVDPVNENKTDTGQPDSIWDGITPLFGIGVLVGLCVLYKFKKK